MATEPYPVRLEVDYPAEVDRWTTLFRPGLAIPVMVLHSLLTSGAEATERIGTDNTAVWSWGSSFTGGLFAATSLMIIVQRRYPRWWFDFARELLRFSARIAAYLALLTDAYPSTVQEQAIHLDIDYPDVERDLNAWMPAVKWLLAIPHYVVLALLVALCVPAVVVAWVAILATRRYPRPIFDFVVGVGRWALRVHGYAFLLVTDRYPPFSML